MQRPLLPHSLCLCSLLLCLFLRYDEARRSIVPRHCLVAGFIASCVCPIELARRRWCRWECMIGNCCEARTLWPFSARGTRIDVGNGRERRALVRHCREAVIAWRQQERQIKLQRALVLPRTLHRNLNTDDLTFRISYL